MEQDLIPRCVEPLSPASLEEKRKFQCQQCGAYFLDLMSKISHFIDGSCRAYNGIVVEHTFRVRYDKIARSLQDFLTDLRDEIENTLFPLVEKRQFRALLKLNINFTSVVNGIAKQQNYWITSQFIPISNKAQAENFFKQALEQIRDRVDSVEKKGSGRKLTCVSKCCLRFANYNY